MNITRDQFSELLHELFEVPTGDNNATDLSDYIKDSIDVGELLAVLKERHQIELDPNSFRTVHTVVEVWALLEAQG